jgi:hypothetical protein
LQRLDAIVERLLAGVARRMAEEKDATEIAPVATADIGRACQSDGHCKRQTVRQGKGANASAVAGEVAATGFSNRLGEGSRRRGVRAPNGK